MCGAIRESPSQSVPAKTRIATIATAIAAGTAQRGASLNRTSHVTTTGNTYNVTDVSAIATNGVRQIGKRMPASMALASGLGMRVIQRPSAGHKPHNTMSTAHTMNAVTTSENEKVPVAPAASKSAAPGVDHAKEIGMRNHSGKIMHVAATTTHKISRPDDAWPGVAPTA